MNSTFPCACLYIAHSQWYCCTTLRLALCFAWLQPNGSQYTCIYMHRSYSAVLPVKPLSMCAPVQNVHDPDARVLQVVLGHCASSHWADSGPPLQFVELWGAIGVYLPEKLRRGRRHTVEIPRKYPRFHPSQSHSQ